MKSILDDAFDVMDSAWGFGKRSTTYALFSGGDDSLVSTHLAMTQRHAQCVLHISTGICAKKDGKSVPLEFVRKTCRRFDWPLQVETPPQMTYRELVLKYGFPGPGWHFMPLPLAERACRA